MECEKLTDKKDEGNGHADKGKVGVVGKVTQNADIEYNVSNDEEGVVFGH